MAANPKLLQDLITIMREDSPPAFFLNKSFDVYNFAKDLFQDIEARRSSVTAITREQATALKKDNLQFSAIKHESRINCLYRMIGLPTEENLDDNFSFSDSAGGKITNKADLTKNLLQREYEQLEITFKASVNAGDVQNLQKEASAAQTQLIAQLFDPNYLQNHTNRLFPMVQFSKIQNVVESSNRIAPSFASSAERYVDKLLTKPPFLETVITIRLLQQSGGAQINTQGAVEDLILRALGYALGELVKQYHKNQTQAEEHITKGTAFIREKPNNVSSPLVKQASSSANSREKDGVTVQDDVINKNIQTQAKIYDAAISLLPTENDVIPIGTSIGDVPFQSRNIKENALTQSFISILNSNIDALQRAMTENKKVMQKRQLVQDKLNADFNSMIGQINGISLAEIIIVLSALFVLDEDDLVGLIPKSRFNQLISASNNNSSSSSSNISSEGQQDTPQKQINIFDILKQFKDSRSSTSTAVKILEDVIRTLYVAFVDELKRAHDLPK